MSMVLMMSPVANSPVVAMTSEIIMIPYIYYDITLFNIYFIIITERLRLGKYDTFHTYLILMIDEITLFNIYFIIIIE